MQARVGRITNDPAMVMKGEGKMVDAQAEINAAKLHDGNSPPVGGTDWVVAVARRAHGVVG